MRTTTTLTSLALAAAAALTAQPRAAEACGGCFSPPETVTSVDSHRMVIALSTTKTTLWDQIRYSGSPQDFVWVLPVPNETATIEVAPAEFFDDLEQGTAPQIQPPPLPPPPSCPPPPGGDWGSSGGQDAAGSSDAGVDVYREEVVGPYQTVLIGSDDPNALLAWLNTNGYNVPSATLPVLSHYTGLGSKFVVLRLAPDQGVNAMQPIRVDYPGYMATFPLKMVTVGAYGKLDLSLWVFAEQRYEARNYGTVEINDSQLVWDFAQGRSNYTEVFRETIQAAGGKAWITEFAQAADYVWFSDYSQIDYIRQTLPYPFLTRLRTEQLLDHLTEDLLLAQSADASWVSNFHQLDQAINVPPPPECPDYNNDGRPDTWEDYNNRGNRIYGCDAGGGAALGAGVLLLLALGGISMRSRNRSRSR
ncbi:MAG TPA: DUF2330 domain-containing protein [Kofleriaceae bacterium]|nr:DUF2330 domain-containing protein [Kofleriaceae bacterium]